jgi:dipeptidyl aminopeptidase/acylaminoacyl peptidase
MKLYVIILIFIFASTAYGSFHTYNQEPQKVRELIKQAEDFLDTMVRGDFATATAGFDDTMKRVMPSDQLEKTWKSVLSSAGQFKSRGSVRTDKVQVYDIVIITCEFEKAPIDVKVVFNASRQIAGLSLNTSYTPPAYAKKDSFTEREITVGEGEWALPGTLSVPNGKGPFPAVVLVHGSGPNDRDESYGPNKTFRDLAWGLASRGVAVIRYEKRTKQHGAKFVALKEGLTVKEESTDDALAAAALLRKTEGIDPKRVFVLGHSLGGMLVPRIGKLDPAITGLIVFAGPTRPLEDLIPEQLDYIFSLDGKITEAEKSEIEKAKKQAEQVKSLKESDAASLAPIFGAPARYWLDIRDYSPQAVAKELKQPLLILQGERDYQVTMKDFEGWQKALSGEKRVTLKSYPRLNHHFVEGENKSVPAEYQQPGHVSEEVITDIAKWITSQK